MPEIEFTPEDFTVAEQYMKEQRARTGVDPSWETCREHALARRGLSSRYAKEINQTNDRDVPGVIGMNVLQRLKVRLQPAEPWLRQVFESGGMARSFTHDEIWAASEYAELHGMDVEEACRVLGFRGLPLAAPKGTP
jgi:hypothetical protein